MSFLLRVVLSLASSGKPRSFIRLGRQLFQSFRNKALYFPDNGFRNLFADSFFHRTRLFFHWSFLFGFGLRGSFRGLFRLWLCLRLFRFFRGPAGLQKDTAAITLSRYGKGRVILFSGHPESSGLERWLRTAARYVAGK